MARSLFHKLARDDRGVSAIEFALIAPVMIVFYFGLVQFCQAYMALKRDSHVASTIADLTAQSATLTKAQINSILEVGPVIMQPFPADTLKQRVSSITRETKTKYTVNWSVGTIGGKLTVADAKLPTDIPAIGESIIVAEANYDYQSPVRNLLPKEFPPGLISFKRRAYLQPRTTNTITCTDC